MLDHFALYAMQAQIEKMGITNPFALAQTAYRLAMEMVGATANAEVNLSDPDDNGNVYNRLVVPRIREED